MAHHHGGDMGIGSRNDNIQKVILTPHPLFMLFPLQYLAGGLPMISASIAHTKTAASCRIGRRLCEAPKQGIYETPVQACTARTKQVTRAAQYKERRYDVAFAPSNVDNLASNSTTLPGIGYHIAHYLNSPDLMFLQEIQDNSGPMDDGVVAANVTLEMLVAAIKDVGGVSYNYLDIDPINDQDGGQPGGNIRVAYLYNPAVLNLKNPNPGSSLHANEVLPGPSLKYNPGRIDPTNPAWQDSRKPLAAQWETVRDKSTLFTVVVHFTSKGGSSSIEGDPRPPVNLGVDQRTAQANVTGTFVAQILAQDPQAAVIVAGDFNEDTFVEPLEMFTAVSGLVDLDDAAGIAPTERYTYVFDMSCEELDHIFVSPKIAGTPGGRPDLKHMHVNTWVTYADQRSDHDPSVASLNIC
ncbi:uncharacterized protein A1O5_10682 [Cladophialophora psammophila CBS 110553]|uniref:Endonuclease/exonuclease/phosphatase domain-containing protein n=1 Tax=Cladophialophora psammophila CBS 110553 TaxID=1182543 RepID=W9WDQ5_9EURO|nr:uncharacterized protein A1O5_10682 [Cladophialophora psammophila CBS 110553]EXJ66068.1 hypothetical protein A1O5_10682 [Cladophialophora psammophila CBS 110553]